MPGWDPECAAAAKGWRLLQLLLATQHATAAAVRLEVGGGRLAPGPAVCPPGPLARSLDAWLLRGGSMYSHRSDLSRVSSQPIPLPEVAMTRQSSWEDVEIQHPAPGATTTTTTTRGGGS